MKNFTEVLTEAKKMQKKMQEVQEKLKTIEAEGIAGGDTVKVVLNGEYELIKLKIDEKILKEKGEIVEDLITAAHNDAKQKLKIKTSEEISKITGGVNLPPGFNFPF